MWKRFIHVVVLTGGLGLLVVGFVAAPAVAAEEAGGLRTGEEAILAALDEKVSLDFIENPLSEVLEFLESTRNVEIEIDTRALDDIGVGTDTPITKQVRDVSLRSALNLVLRDLDLAWTIRDEVLMITTPEEAELFLITRVYDVHELTTVHDKAGKAWQDFDSLIPVVTTVAPDSWDSVGGPGSVAPLEYRGAKVLVIRQTADIHRQLGRLFDDLARIADKYGDDVYPTREKWSPHEHAFDTGAGLEECPSTPSQSGTGGLGSGQGGMGGGSDQPLGGRMGNGYM